MILIQISLTLVRQCRVMNIQHNRLNSRCKISILTSGSYNKIQVFKHSFDKDFKKLSHGLEQQPEQQPLAQAPAQPQQPNQAPTQQQQQPNQAPTQQQQQPNQAPTQQQQQPSAQAPAKSQKPTAPATNSQAVQQVIDLTNADQKKRATCFNC